MKINALALRNQRAFYLQQKQEIVCEFRRVSKLLLDDVYSALKKKIPNLISSNLHRCLKRNGLNVLPKDYVELHSKMLANESSAFLKNLIAHCPFKITNILTDNGNAIYL
ncbi:hypothetical protein [Holospora obtusa]|uniref:hypothetical protein n=1 Tax=Holospora obtusa TaxID=49893 RepID=UPI0003AEA315|nr:hypothetical protein [Holospora obtusa]